MSKRNESLSYYLKKYNIDKDDSYVRSVLRRKYGVSIKKLTNEELAKLYIEYNEKQKLNFGKFRNIEINGVTYKSLRDACTKLGLVYETVHKYISNNPDTSVNEVILIFIDKKEKEKEKISFRKLCAVNNVNYQTALKHRKDNRNLTDVQVVNNLRMNKVSFKEKCISRNVNYGIALKIRRNNKLTDDEAIEMTIKHCNRLGFREKCELAGVSYTAANAARYRHKELTEDEIIELMSKKRLSFKEKCELAGVSYIAACYMKTKYPEFNDEQIIDKVSNRDISFKEKCRLADINYDNALQMRRRTGLKDEEIITIFNPRCFYNILGEFVIVSSKRI